MVRVFGEDNNLSFEEYEKDKRDEVKEIVFNEFKDELEILFERDNKLFIKSYVADKRIISVKYLIKFMVGLNQDKIFGSLEDLRQIKAQLRLDSDWSVKKRGAIIERLEKIFKNMEEALIWMRQ